MNCLNEKDIINTYKNFGYDVFKIDFDGYKSIIHFKDKNEYKYKCSYEWVKHHNNFKPVIVSNPYSIDNIKQYILNKKLNVTLLSTEFEVDINLKKTGIIFKEHIMLFVQNVLSKKLAKTEKGVMKNIV